MKYLKLIALFWLGLPIWCSAQLKILDSSTQTISSRVDLTRSELASGTISGAPSEYIADLQLSIENGDILINYRLSALEEGQFYEVLPLIRLNGQRLLLAADEFRGNFGRPVPSGTQQIVWLNPQERYINLSGQLEIELRVNQWGEQESPYNCALGAPTFNNKQKRPYLLAAGVGITGIGLGQLFKQSRNDNYDQYQNAGALADATPYYEEANRHHHTYLILTWAGVGILAADAVLYLIRQNKYKRELKYYETYCRPNSIGLQPVLELPNGDLSPGGSIGLKLTLPIHGK